MREQIGFGAAEWGMAKRFSILGRRQGASSCSILPEYAFLCINLEILSEIEKIVELN